MCLVFIERLSWDPSFWWRARGAAFDLRVDGAARRLRSHARRLDGLHVRHLGDVNALRTQFACDLAEERQAG